MVDYVTLKAILNATQGTEVVGLVLVLLVKHVIALLRWTLLHVGVLVPDLFPFELLTPIHLLRGQEILQIRKWNGQFASRLRAHDRKLLVLDTSRQPRVDALNVIDIVADSKSKHSGVLIREQGLLANLADILIGFLSFTRLFFFQLVQDPLLHILCRLLEDLSFFLSLHLILSLLLFSLEHISDRLLLPQNLQVLIAPYSIVIVVSCIRLALFFVELRLLIYYHCLVVSRKSIFSKERFLFNWFLWRLFFFFFRRLRPTVDKRGLAPAG